MAKFLTPDLIRFLLPLAIAFAEQAAAKSESKVDDQLVAVLKNPAVQAYILALLAGDEPTPKTEEEKVIHENQGAVKALFACAEALAA